jgi:hypothetical protein
LLPLFSLILLPEYVQGLGDPETKSLLYRATIGPLRVVDVVLLAIIAAHGTIWASSRSSLLRFPREMAMPGFGFLAAISMGMVYGRLHGGGNLFFDWRALALGVGMYAVFAMWLQSPAQVRSATCLFGVFMALRIGLIYASFLMGGGDVIVGLRIPVFDGPTVSTIVFTGVLALCVSDHAIELRTRLLWTGLSVACYLLVLLCFRRTFWAELGIATAIVLVLQKKRRGRKFLLAMSTVCAVAVALGPSFIERMRSMDFTAGESEFSQGNPDHVGEVLDAWEQVQRAPLFGIGLGQAYPTLRIQDWKEESVMVHNAPLHVWLKYGLVGLVCYSWFHVALFRWLWRRHKAAAPNSSLTGHYLFRTATPSLNELWLGAALAYVAAQFVVSLGFSPWPYSSVQSAVLNAFILAVAITGTRQCRSQVSPS